MLEILQRTGGDTSLHPVDFLLEPGLFLGIPATYSRLLESYHSRPKGIVIKQLNQDIRENGWLYKMYENDGKDHEKYISYTKYTPLPENQSTLFKKTEEFRRYPGYSELILRTAAQDKDPIDLDQIFKVRNTNAANLSSLLRIFHLKRRNPFDLEKVLNVCCPDCLLLMDAILSREIRMAIEPALIGEKGITTLENSGKPYEKQLGSAYRKRMRIADNNTSILDNSVGVKISSMTFHTENY